MVNGLSSGEDSSSAYPSSSEDSVPGSSSSLDSNSTSYLSIASNETIKHSPNHQSIGSMETQTAPSAKLPPNHSNTNSQSYNTQSMELNSLSPKQVQMLERMLSSELFLSLQNEEPTSGASKIPINIDVPSQKANMPMHANIKLTAQTKTQISNNSFAPPHVITPHVNYNKHNKSQKSLGYNVKSGDSYASSSMVGRGFSLDSDESTRLSDCIEQKCNAQFIKIQEIVEEVKEMGKYYHHRNPAIPPKCFHNSNGQNQSAYDFLRSFVYYSDGARCGALDQYFCWEIEPFLRGKAKIWFDNSAEFKTSGFEVFAQRFLKIFCSNKLDDKEIKLKIESRFQKKTETFHDYMFDMMEYFAGLYHELSEYEKIEALLRNARLEYKEQISTEIFYSVNELVERMIQVERVISEKRKWAERDAREEREANLPQNHHHNNSYTHPSEPNQENNKRRHIKTSTLSEKILVPSTRVNILRGVKTSRKERRTHRANKLHLETQGHNFQATTRRHRRRNLPVL